MRSYFYETTSDLSPERLYRAITDIQCWPAWDGGIETVSIEGPVETGAEFTVKPRGRATVRLRVETMAEPYRFADIAYLPLAQLRTEHSFLPAPDGTLVRSSIDIRGLLAGYWDRPLAESYAEGAAMHMRRFLAFARSHQAGQKETAAPTGRPLPNYVFC